MGFDLLLATHSHDAHHRVGYGEAVIVGADASSSSVIF